MSNRVERGLAIGLGACALGAALAALAADTTPREALRGVWTAERSKWRVKDAGSATLVQLSLRRTGAHGNWDSSHPVPLGELEGLAAAQIEAPSADVRFQWKRDAGSFAFDGRFEKGDGAGHFSFTPSAAYIAELRSRGYGDIDEEKALMLAIHDVSRALIAELAGLGYKRLSLDQLVSMRIHGASLDFVRDLQGLGYAGVPAEDLVAFRIHGVTPEFVRALRGLGYDHPDGEELVSMRIHGVTPEFVKDLKGLGYGSVPVDDLVSLRIHGVTPDFIRRVQQRAGKGVALERLVSMRIHGEDPE